MNLSKPDLSKLAQGILNISFQRVHGDKIPNEGNHNLCTPASKRRVEEFSIEESVELMSSRSF